MVPGGTGGGGDALRGFGSRASRHLVPARRTRSSILVLQGCSEEGMNARVGKRLARRTCSINELKTAPNSPVSQGFVMFNFQVTHLWVPLISTATPNSYLSKGDSPGLDGTARLGKRPLKPVGL